MRSSLPLMHPCLSSARYSINAGLSAALLITSILTKCFSMISKKSLLSCDRISLL